MKIENFLKPSYMTEKKLSKHTQLLLMNWAKKAHKLDKSNSISFYYELFLNRFNKKQLTENEVSDFFWR